MPAAAVIPAPVAYIKVVAVKKLVVGFLTAGTWPAVVRRVSAGVPVSSFQTAVLPSRVGAVIWIFYFEEIGVFKAGLRQNILAWNNNLGLLFYFVGF